jgi:hypothetical protein
MLQSSIIPTTVVSKKKVTLVVDNNESKQEEEQIEEFDKKLINYTPLQQRIKRKIKDLSKKISKHRHVYVERSYEQELADREDDDDDVHDEDSLSATDEVQEIIEEEPDIMDETVQNDGDEVLSNLDDNPDEDTEKTEDDDDDKKTDVADSEDGEDEDREDISETDPECFTEESNMHVGIGFLNEDIVESFANNMENDAKIDFGNNTMYERFIFYKTILKNTLSIDFGDISELF